MNNVGVFISHLGLGDIILLLPAIAHYASTCKLLYFFCKDIYISSVKPFLSKYDNIEILSVNAQLGQGDCEKQMKQEIQTIINTHGVISIFPSGGYCKQHNPFIDFPNHFYKDLQLDFHNTLAQYNIPNTPNAYKLYNKILETNKQFIFLHTTASNLDIELDIDVSNTDVIIINPEKNMYTPTHVYYSIVEEFLRINNNYTLIDYKLLIENASELHLIDSSYFCFAALCKPRKPHIKIVYSRYEQPFNTLLNNSSWQQLYYCK